MLFDPIALTVLATIFREAVVLLLIVIFVPTVAIVSLINRPRD